MITSDKEEYLTPEWYKDIINEILSYEFIYQDILKYYIKAEDSLSRLEFNSEKYNARLYK